MSTLTLDKQIVRLGESNNVEELQKLIEQTSAKTLITALSEKLGRSDCITFWSYLLIGLNTNKVEAQEKRFACVKSFLDGLLKIELSYKQAYDLITRLCQDLGTFPTQQLVELLEHCLDGIRMGDPKCVSWRDILPANINILSFQPQLRANGILMTGPEYRKATLRILFAMRWPKEVLTPIAAMFRELHLNAQEVNIVLNKFAGALQCLPPEELPPLAFQLFTLSSNAAEIIIPILALESYFHRLYYKKLFADMMSNTTDLDSIDIYCDKELRDAEETILYHLSYCTLYKISEMQMCSVLKNFICMPDIILSPFVLSAIISMTAVNREPQSKPLSTSVLLHFLRHVIQNNEKERTLADYSVWCRDCLQRKQVHLEHVFTVLIDQNKEGQDVITPGLVNLAFVLLKVKNNAAVHSLAIGFLTKFIRKRFVFGKGIIDKLAKWMIVEQEQPQYSECLMTLSVADTFTVSECFDTINYVLDFFLWLPGEEAMRMMAFILPILKISPTVRDVFIDMLRKAMGSSNVKTCRMAVYGFCMVLKQLNNSNSQRSQIAPSGFCTQYSISGFSLMSQATMGARHNPQRHFDMLTLEIIGILRQCFNQGSEIKCTLYENLQRAVDLNPKLVSHVLQFIDWHFRSYFRIASRRNDISRSGSTGAGAVSPTQEIAEFGVEFEKLVHAKDEHDMEIEINDNLGRLVVFVSHCLVLFEKSESVYDVREMQILLNVSLEKIIAKDFKFEEKSGSLTALKNELITQQMNFIEGLMAYVLLTSKQNNNNVKHLLPLFRQHTKLGETLKSLSSSTKKSNKKDASASANITINGVAVKKINTNVENIWDLEVIEKMLRLLHEDVVPFAAANNTTALRSNCELVRYVLAVTISKVENIRLEPEYKQLAHSKRTLKYLTDITKVIYEQCIKRLPELWRDFDVKTAALAAECLQNCLQTANVMYKKKFVDVFQKGFDFYQIINCKEAPAQLHNIIDEFMKDYTSSTKIQSSRGKDDLSKDADARRIPHALLKCLEVLYDNVPLENRMSIESYSWLLSFCKEYAVHSRDMSLVHKLLFTQRQKTHSGAFFHCIALHLCQVWNAISDEQFEAQCNTDGGQSQINFDLKSITCDSAESYFSHLCAAVHKQIEDVEYFIVKANNYGYKYRIVAEDDRDMCLAQLRSLERFICSQLVHISNTLLNLTNACIPLGACLEQALRLIMQHFQCLKNLAKHFLNCCAFLSVNIQGSKFDSLLRTVGKPLPHNIYALIAYIESNVCDKRDQKAKRNDPQADRAKVLRETKLIPKIILYIEDFNKHVLLLAKKTNDRLANMMHRGIVRDYHFRSHTLTAAVNRTLSRSREIELDPSNLTDEDEEETLLKRMEAESAELPDPNSASDDNEETDENGSTTTSTSSAAKSPRQHITSDEEDDDANITTPEDVVVLEDESNEESAAQLFKNLAKINLKAKKRDSSEKIDPDVAEAPPPKKPRKRSSKL